MMGLPQGWSRTPGENLFEYVRGVTYQKQQARDAAEEGYTGVLRATNIQDGHLDNNNLVYVPSELVNEKQILRLGDQVIASSSGSKSVVGKAAPVSDKIVGLSFGAFCAVARPRSGDIQDWIRLFFQSPEYRQFVNEAAMGNNINNLRSSDLIAVGVPLAPLTEQRRIVAKADGLTARTARARKELDRIPTLIARYKQRILALAFSGELTTGWRRMNSVQASWKTKAVGDLITDVIGGKNLRCVERPPEKHEKGVVKVSAVTWGEFDPFASKTLPVSFEPPLKSKIRNGDFLISRANTLELVAAVVIVKETPDNLYLSDKILRLEMPEADKPWLLWFLRSPTGRMAIETRATGNQHSMRNLSQSGLRSIEMPWPSARERAEIVRRIESAFGWLDRMAADHAAAARLLPKLNAAILAKAFRGELVSQDLKDEPARMLLERIKVEREAEGRKPKSGRGRKPNGSKEQLMAEKALAPRDRLLKDSELWPAVGLSFEAIAMRNSIPHDALRDALFDLLSGPSPALQQRFDTDAELMVIQRVAA